MKQDFSDLTFNGISCPICFVKGGTFDMGEGRDDSYTITVPSFFMGQYQVTQALYEAVMETNPSRFKGVNCPVEGVSWNDAKAFIKKLNSITQKKIRLPTESEWEYAARGGMNNQGYDYCGSDDLKQVGWYRDNSGREAKPVGLLLPNELGLYDMSGNVYEWCEDDWHTDYDSPNRPNDGSAWIDSPSRAANRVIRGCSYFDNADCCRPAHRYHYSSDNRYNFIGFRLVFSLQS